MTLIYKIIDQVLRYTIGKRLVIREGGKVRDLYTGKYKVNGAIKKLNKTQSTRSTHPIKCHHWTGEEYIINL